MVFEYIETYRLTPETLKKYLERLFPDPSLVTKLNADVLMEVLEHYKSLTEAVGFPAAIQDGCSGEVSEFFQ